VITNDFDLIRQVSQVERLVYKLARSTGNLFAVKTRAGLKTKYIHKSQLGELFVECINFNLTQLPRHFPSHQFNPHFELFKQHVSARNLGEIVCWMNRPVSEVDVIKWFDILKGCAKSIHEEANSARFKKAVNAFHHAANKNFRELFQYFVSIVDIQADRPLAVARYDFGYSKDQYWPVVETAVQYADVKKHWDEMMKSLNKKLPSDCLAGYAWRLTSSRDNSYNFHLVTFTDKSKVPEGISIERIAFDLWGELTGGKGLAFNCNLFKAASNSAFHEEYKSCGIGMSNDYAVREELKQVAFYMTQPDYLVRFVTPDKGRTFGKGVLPKLIVSEQAVEGTTSSKSKKEGN
jgi:hypothetical protein